MFFHCMFIPDAFFEKKQAILTFESDSAQYQAQVKELEAKSAEKNNLVTNYEAMVKVRLIHKLHVIRKYTCTCTYMYMYIRRPFPALL